MSIYNRVHTCFFSQKKQKSNIGDSGAGATVMFEVMHRRHSTRHQHQQYSAKGLKISKINAMSADCNWLNIAALGNVAII